jgi:hypothetical protein
MAPRPRLLILALAFYLVGSLMTTPAAQAATMTYNRSGAVAYANRWAANGQNLMNPQAYRLGNDCTNFVSQSVHGGSVAYDMGGGADIGWYPHYQSWDAVHMFDYFWHQLQGKVTYLSVTMSSAYTSAEAGDVYMYDWGRGEGWSHVSIETGWGAFANWSDSGKTYSSVTGGSGDYINQHTTDRWHSPWNWGYWTETSPTIRASMKTVILHFNT